MAEAIGRGRPGSEQALILSLKGYYFNTYKILFWYFIGAFDGPRPRNYLQGKPRQSVPAPRPGRHLYT